MQLFFHDKPFFHITTSFDQETYNEVLSFWETQTHTNHNESSGNRSNIEIPRSIELHKKLSDFIFTCNEYSATELIKHYPKLIKTGAELKTRILCSENISSDYPYKIRGWHLDSGDKFIVGLWYFKHPDEEEDCGGDLLLMNPSTKDFKLVKYEANTLVIFPNTPNAWHAITPRKPSKYPRRYVNLLLESPEITLHNYRRNGTSVDDEFRGKLINYQK